jgi:lipopolysaccharide export system protein LptA
MLNMFSKISATVLGLTLLAGVAHAQFSFDGDEQILIDADKATYEGELTILEGNVDVRQGSATIYSDQMKIYRAADSTGGETSGDLGVVSRIEASGNFKYVTPDNTVTGNRGVYERSTGLIIVTGDVKLIQPSGSRVSGEKLTYNIKSKSARFGDTCRGENCNGRVTFNIKN